MPLAESYKEAQKIHSCKERFLLIPVLNFFMFRDVEKCRRLSQGNVSSPPLREFKLRINDDTWEYSAERMCALDINSRFIDHLLYARYSSTCINLKNLLKNLRVDCVLLFPIL